VRENIIFFLQCLRGSVLSDISAGKEIKMRKGKEKKVNLKEKVKRFFFFLINGGISQKGAKMKRV